MLKKGGELSHQNKGKDKKLSRQTDFENHFIVEHDKKIAK